jgi:hypothetical protein
MLAISRNTIRQFRSVLKRAGLHRIVALKPSFLCADASPTTLHLSAGNVSLVVEWRVPGSFAPERFLLDPEALQFCEGRSADLVQFVPGDDRQVQVTWSDRGVPKTRSFTTPEEVEPLVVPTPETWGTNEPGFLKALHEAMQTTDPDSVRFGTGCVQLQGAAGAMNATDSHQLLRQTGFQFPWQEDLLVGRTEVFGLREWPHDEPVRIGKTQDWVTLRFGDWAVHLAVPAEPRFPDVTKVIPPASAIATRLQLDPRDASFLAETLHRLPDPNSPEHPVTVDLNGHVAVRARGEEPTVTELVLRHSRREGPAVRLSINREYLARAIAMGYRELGIIDAKSPVLCDDGKRQYLWMVLEGTGLDPSDTAVIVPSPDGPAPRPVTAQRQTPSTPKAGPPVPATAPPVNRIAALTTSTAPVPVDLIAQAEKVRDALRGTLQEVGTLITAARQQRRQSRLTKTTLNSLKQLRTLCLE